MVSMASQHRLSQLVDEIPDYPILRGSIATDGVAMPRLKQRLMAMEPKSVSDIDGIKLEFEDGWLLIRASGTESKIRVTAEAKGEARVRQLYDSGIEAINKCRDSLAT